MFGVGHMPQIALMLIVALLVFGPRKLPEIGSAFGRGIREFKDATTGLHAHHTPEIAEPVIAPVAQVTPTEIRSLADRR